MQLKVFFLHLISKEKSQKLVIPNDKLRCIDFRFLIEKVEVFQFFDILDESYVKKRGKNEKWNPLDIVIKSMLQTQPISTLVGCISHIS